LVDGNNPFGIRVTINNSNVGGVTAGTGAGNGLDVMTGVELAIPLSAIGSPTGAFKVCVFVNGLFHDYLSNQVLAGIGGGGNLGEPRLVNFGNIPGEQYFWVPMLYNIAGRVELRDWDAPLVGMPVWVELRQGSNTIRTDTVYLDHDGSYTIPGVGNGVYDIAFKASHWLRTVVRSVEVMDADVTGVDVSLTNGDIDGDNEVTLFDFGALVAAFGSVPGDSNWNPDADLDGDEEVTLFDFGILVRNFGAIGDE
ncbi:MAG: hypothetical protein ACP5RN_06715, partial [Armatimonadota bacterium]